MELTKENKQHIDSLSLYQLQEKWRFAPAGDPWFQGETGEYWGKRISELRAKSPNEYVSNSKAMGWGGG